MPKRKIPSGNTKSEQSLTPDEGLIGIGLLSMAVDSQVESVETEMLVELLDAIEYFEEYSEEEIDESLEKIKAIAREEGGAALFNSSLAALTDEEYQEAGLIIAMLVVSADGEIPEEEEDYLTAIQQRLGISDERYDELVDELFEEEDYEEEEEEEEE
ncbi:tellurite resistance TerB family protein [Pantanalinema rosaneae CENA516]|uniref:tellurite resistance TerB family protein n=1 Tax=Pantanalinema rosaneae TaxID=1620701 RepID=UPI003D6DEDE5